MFREADADNVRVAQPGDEAELLALVRQHHNENGLGTFSAEKVLSVLRRAFDPGRNDPAIVGVVGQGQIEGSIGMVVDQPWASETSILVVLWSYVLPPYRASGHLKDLTAFGQRMSEPWPNGLGIPLVFDANSSGRSEAVVRLYRRQLGAPAVMSWICEGAI